jgi:osmotically-inducible protein OsmY
MRIFIARSFALVLIVLSMLFAACEKQLVDDAVLTASVKTQMKEQVKEAANNVTEEVKKEAGEAVLLGKIKAKLIAVGFSDITVEVDQGEATLKGEILSEKDRIAVEVIVEKTEGINKVNNQLNVRNP